VSAFFKPVSGPFVHGIVEVHHAAGIESVIGHGKIGSCMSPVFEDLSVHRLQFVKHVGMISFESCPEGMVVGSFHNGNGIYLHITQVPYDSFDLKAVFKRSGRMTQHLRTQYQPSCLVCSYLHCHPLIETLILRKIVILFLERDYLVQIRA